MTQSAVQKIYSKRTSNEEVTLVDKHKFVEIFLGRETISSHNTMVTIPNQNYNQPHSEHLFPIDYGGKINLL